MHCLYLYLRAFARKNNATVEIPPALGGKIQYISKNCVFNSAGRERGRLDSEDYRMCIVNLMLGI